MTLYDKNGREKNPSHHIPEDQQETYDGSSSFALDLSQCVNPFSGGFLCYDFLS